MKINYKDTSMLTKEEKTTLQTISSEYSEKIAVKELRIDVKVVNKGGKRKRYTININTKDYHAHVEDWNLGKALHSALNKIISEINHKKKKNILHRLLKR
ncbi:MAG: hypothetical protein KAQ83_03655 [Nanoarchaeota archaeon]|nr:hypothetical protein [Nanoarchaeota archaeon]